MIFSITLSVVLTIMILLYYFNTEEWHTFSMWVTGFRAAMSGYDLITNRYVEALFLWLPTIAILVVLLVRRLIKYEQ